MVQVQRVNMSNLQRQPESQVSNKINVVKLVIGITIMISCELNKDINLHYSP